MTATTKRYQNPEEFPYEAFVQKAVEAHFAAQGFQIIEGGYSDLKCSDAATGQQWLIEAKGQTADVGLDFRTGLGQLLQAMQDSSVFYGLAIPDTPSFGAQCQRVSAWVREALRLHWLVVGPDGSVAVIKPDDV